MTALAGLLNFTGNIPPRQNCERMLRAQAAYGGPRSGFWSDEKLALGKRLYPTLPEDIYDRGPGTSISGRYALAADIRLDSRKELADRLALSRSEVARLSDSTLLRQAWERWGDATIDLLSGDFAIAVWDRSKQELLLARDFCGHRPLCFARTSGFFAFASMPSGLHALAEIPYELDKQALHEFIWRNPNLASRSFFKGIEVVRPGHLLRVSHSGIHSKKHWSPSVELIRLRDPRDYAERVRDLLDRAVAAQLRGVGREVAAHLSGGLDSSAVVTSAALQLDGNARILAYTSAPEQGTAKDRPGRVADEQHLAGKTAALYPNIEHVVIHGSGQPPLQGVDKAFQLFQRPVPNLCNYGWSSAIYDHVKQRGVAVLLTGDSGNLSFSHDGAELLPQLLRHGHLAQLALEVVALVRNGSRPKQVIASTLGPFLPKGAWRIWQRVRRKGVSAADFTLGKEEPTSSNVNPVDFSSQPDMYLLSRRIRAFELFDNGNFNKGTLAGWGIDIRDPTADRNLVEFCLRIPPEQYLRSGDHRALARLMLQKRLPAEVVSERRRGYQAADWHKGIVDSRVAMLAEVERLERDSIASELLDLRAMKTLLQSSPPNWDSNHIERRYRVALLRGMSAGYFARKVAGSNY